MTGETDAVQVWLVERGYNNRDLIVLKYATPDGERVFRTELAAQVIDADTATAAREVPPEDLAPVEDPELRDRFADEADRMAAEHDPGDPV